MRGPAGSTRGHRPTARRDRGLDPHRRSANGRRRHRPPSGAGLQLPGPSRLPRGVPVRGGDETCTPTRATSSPVPRGRPPHLGSSDLPVAGCLEGQPASYRRAPATPRDRSRPPGPPGQAPPSPPIIGGNGPTYRCVFPAGPLDRDVAEAAETLRADSARAILATLMEEPGLSGRAVAEAVDVSPSAVSYPLGNLAEAGLVEKERDGRSLALQLPDPGPRAAADPGLGAPPQGRAPVAPPDPPLPGEARTDRLTCRATRPRPGPTPRREGEPPRDVQPASCSRDRPPRAGPRCGGPTGAACPGPRRAP